MVDRDFNSLTMQSQVADLFRRVYAWMSVGLSVSALTAYYISTTPVLYRFLFKSAGLMSMLFLAQIGLVMVLSACINRIGFSTAAALFLLYAFSLGLTLSGIFIVYTMSSVFAVFLITGGMFGAMSAYGYFTQADLTSMGSYLFMGVVGLMIATIVNGFLVSSELQFITSLFGVFIFVVLTAWDTQRIKQIGLEVGFATRESMNKAALFGALALYLDFINVFLFILQLLGRRR